MMIKKQNRHIGIALTMLIGFGLLLSTLAMAPNQATATPTLEPTITNTEMPTATPTLTLTPTFTPSPSATPTYSISEPLQTEFANVNEKLDRLDSNPIVAHSANILDNILSSVIVFAWLAFVGFVKRLLKLKNTQEESAGKTPNRILVNLEIVLGDIFQFSKWLLAGLILIWSVSYLGQSISQSSNHSELNGISTQIAQIQNQINTFPKTTPTTIPSADDFITPYSPTSTPAVSSNTELQISSIISLVGLGVIISLFFALASMISRNQATIYGSALPNLNMGILGRKLLPAIFLVLVLQLLPSPIDTFLLPILIPFILFAFFDIVLLYPNSKLQNVVKKYYPEIIFWSVFVVWLRALQELQSYLSLLWEKSGNYASSTLTEFFRTQQNPISFIVSNQSWEQILNMLITYGWVLLPYLIALAYTSRPSRRIRKITEEKYIKKIIQAGEGKSE